MKKILAILALVAFSTTALAEDISPAAAAREEWRAYVETLAPIGERLVPLMEDPQDPLLRQELYRMIFMGASLGYMALLHADPAHPDLIPVLNQIYNFWAPNPDDVYYMTPVNADGVYKISGFRGTVKIVDFQIGGGTLIPQGTGPVTATLDNYDLDRDVHPKKDGSFEVILSAKRPEGYKGDWWKLNEKASYILLRQISYDWLHEVDARIAIERLDRPILKPRPDAQQLQAQMRAISEWTENWTKLGMQWMKKYHARGPANMVTVNAIPDGGHERQKYIEGLFEIQPDEALIYETEIPAKCRYWSISLTDMLWSAIDYGFRQSNLNGYSAKLDKDGKFRAVVSATDPGVPNWLDTGGYVKGVFFGRWTECSSAPVPKLTKVKLADVRKYLPADTPVVSAEAREASLRLRQKAAQLRRRW